MQLQSDISNIIIMALLHERRSRRLSTFPAGMMVTYQTNMGLASPVAATAGQGLVRFLCRGCTVLPPLSFFMDGGPIGGFKGGGSFVYGVSPGAMVFGRSSINALLKSQGLYFSCGHKTFSEIIHHMNEFPVSSERT